MKYNGEKNILITILKLFIVVAVLVVQYLVLEYIYSKTYQIYLYSNTVFKIIEFIFVMYIVYKHDNPSYKISWLLLIIVSPVLGVVTYALFSNSKIPKRVQKRVDKITKETNDMLHHENEILKIIKKQDKRIYNSIEYIKNTTGYPVYENVECKYLEKGEKYLYSMINDMKKAEKYILIEYFIVSKGKIFNEIFKVLEEKAKQGVQIYFMNDDVGSMMSKPKNLKHKLQKIGVKYVDFNRLTPIVTTYLNNRDHRKITVIDGKIAYTGGINIGDEYANINSKLGYWKDTGIRIEGPAVWSFVVMFFRMWEVYNKEEIDLKFFETEINKDVEEKINNGYIFPFCDGPYNKNNPAEMIYMDILNKVKDYVYITTPYLIIDNEMLTSLCNCAKSGIDVRILMPGIPDKKLVYITSRSYYDELLKAGVKIYEYTPGFVHAKTFVSDDEVSVVGSINMDFRSLYLHYEVGCYLYKTDISNIMKTDFLNMLENSKEVTLSQWGKRNFFMRSIESILIAFSGML